MWSLLACAAPVADAPPAGDLAELPDLPTSTCGGQAYDWAPLDGMGALVDVDEAHDYALARATIELMLATNGITAFAPAHDIVGWRIRYVTQDHGVPVEATAAVLAPATEGDFPLVAFAHGTTGFSDACAPSAGTWEDQGFALLVASLGYFVVAPDYLGMSGFGAPSGFLHPWLVPEPTAVAVLDGLRAGLRLAEEEGTAARPDPTRVGVWGASEGGFAALHADRYAPRYAPELTVRAVVASVPPTDVQALARIGVTVPSPTTVAFAALLATQNPWHGAPSPLADALVADVAAALPGELAAECSDFPSLTGADAVDDVFTTSFVTSTAASDWSGDFGCYLTAATLAESPVPMDVATPTLVVAAGADDLVWAETVRESVPVLSAQGMAIEYRECAGMSHVDAALSTFPLQADWFAARLAGEAWAPEVHAAEDCSGYLTE